MSSQRGWGESIFSLRLLDATLTYSCGPDLAVREELLTWTRNLISFWLMCQIASETLKSGDEVSCATDPAVECNFATHPGKGTPAIQASQQLDLCHI